jgi:hypothetical protein
LALFDRHAFRQVAGFIDVAAAQNGDVVGQSWSGTTVTRGSAWDELWHVNHVIAMITDHCISL